MPLPPLPANNTYRLFVIQEGTAGRHETVFRFGAAVSQADAITRARAICTAFAPLLSTGVSFTSARAQNAGESVSFPVVWGTAIPGTAAAAVTGELRPQFVSMVGRSAAGRRVRIMFFGFPTGMSNDYRILASDGAGFANAITVVRDGLPGLAARDGAVAIWNSYINCGRHAYFQRKLRRTG
jgi:hypothetical protein